MKQSRKTDWSIYNTDVVKMKRRKALQLVSGMLSLSLLIVALGIYTSTRTESLSITGYASGAILAFGSFLGVLGLCLEENRKQLDMRPVKAGRCQFFTSGNSYIYENYYASVQCQGLTESCSLKVRSGTCYCCDLYDCANGGYLNNYYEFVGVQSCEDILSLYILIWVLTLLNLLAFILAILTTAVLGSIKDLVRERPREIQSLIRKSLVSSLSLSHDSSIVSSPTAPLLTDHNTQSAQQLYPKASLYVSPAGSGAPAADSQSGHLETQTNTEPNPPPFAPLYNLLPYKG
ncbi:transmembrane protein 255B isoform X3 [Salminus brasiliensis]|uniref:transmembrane protein 255B isoform X3 n=1 Tax=Salminus brasiliensis TaxID=930266 RepID=UPI003B8312A7